MESDHVDAFKCTMLGKVKKINKKRVYYDAVMTINENLDGKYQSAYRY